MEAQSLPRNGRLFLPRSPKVLAALGDERLVEQVRRGNDAAFEVLYDRYHRGILSFCRHMLASPDEAEDAVQQTFVSAYSALRSDARDIRVKPWLYTIARNRCLSTLRARREQPCEIGEVPTAGLPDEAQQRSDLRDLLADMDELPVEQRAALVLSELGDLSHAEVGAVVGCEVAKVKSLVFQARSSLIESRRARDIPCHEIREQLATLRGGALRRAPLRRHLKSCEGCAEFRDDVRRQRKALAAILPVVPSLGLKQSALAAIGIGGGGGAAAGGGGVAAGGGIASLVTSGAAVKVATVLTIAGVAVGGGIVLEQRSPTRQAEAAGGQDGGGQAWPAPPAGVGPGTHAIAKTPAKHPASRAHKHARGLPAATRTSTPERATPVAQHRAKAHRRHGAGRHEGRPIGRGPDRHPTAQTQPPPAAPATPATPSSPAEPTAPADDGQGHHGHGHHYGWQQGVGNQGHEHDWSGQQDDSQSGDGGESGHGDGAQGHKGSDEGDSHHRALARVAGELPPGP